MDKLTYGVDPSQLSVNLEQLIQPQEVKAIVSHIGIGFGYFIGTLYECSQSKSKEKNFMLFKNILTLDAYTYLRLVVPVVREVMGLTRDIFEPFTEFKPVDFVQDKVLQKIHDQATKCEQLLEFATDIHTEVSAVELTREEKFWVVIKAKEKRLAEEAKLEQKNAKKALQDTFDNFKKDFSSGKPITQDDLKKQITKNQIHDDLELEGHRLLKEFIMPALKIYVKSLQQMTKVINLIKDLTGNVKRRAGDIEFLNLILKDSVNITNATLAVSGMYTEFASYVSSIKYSISQAEAKEAYLRTKNNGQNLYVNVIKAADQSFAKLSQKGCSEEFKNIASKIAGLKLEADKQAIEQDIRDFPEEVKDNQDEEDF